MTRSLIDYYGESDDPEPTFNGIKRHWIKRKEEETGINYQWSMKDQSLLSRFLKEYSGSEIVTLIDFYLTYHPENSFGVFFKERENLYMRVIKPENYGFD